MNTQHTPGPWGSSGTAGHETHGQFAVYHLGTGKDIAIVYDGKAHANLIASAPRLLAELRGLVEQLDAIGIPDWHGAEGLDLDGAEIAILEATGGDPAVIAKMRGDRAEVPLARNEKIAKEIRELSTIECAECGHCFLVGNSNPDLLADLLAALDDITDLPANDDGSRIIPAGYLDAARAAIAKARGQ